MNGGCQRRKPFTIFYSLFTHWRFPLFRVTADYDEQIEVGVDQSAARAFFNELRNFVELMPGVEAIEALPDGNKRWTISAPVPMIGSIKQSFIAAETANTEERIEWSPAPGEAGNLLRYSADFTPRGESRTNVRIRLKVEVRREKATDLYMMARWVGEDRISKEMQRGVTMMMNIFTEKAKAKLKG